METGTDVVNDIKHEEVVDIVKEELGNIRDILPNKTTSQYGSLLRALGYKEIRLNLDTNEAEINGKVLNEFFWARIRTDFRDLGYEKHLDAIKDYVLAQAYDNSYTPKSVLEIEDRL